MVIEHFFNSRDELFEALSAYCRETLAHAIATNGKAGFFVSGGSTPAPLYERLAQSDLDWPQINVALVDERWVEPDDNSSNQRFIESSLLQGNASSAKFTPMKNPQATAKAGLETTAKAYEAIDSLWDLTILGMGNDGHTASIFPHCEGLSEALDTDSSAKLSAIMANKSEVTGDNLERMTLSMAGLMASRSLVLLITGQSKLDVYRQALESNDAQSTPISAVLQQQKVPVHVYWSA